MIAAHSFDTSPERGSGTTGFFLVPKIRLRVCVE